MHMPETKKGYRCIVAARHDVSGFCEAQALQKLSSKVVAHFLWSHIICRYGIPQSMMSDNGREFQGAFNRLMTHIRIPLRRISPYNHHTVGVVERGHFTLREAMAKCCRGQGGRWPQSFPLALFADRITLSRVTGFSPYKLLHGCDPVLSMDLAEATFLVQDFHPGMTTSDLLAARMRQLERRPEDLERAAATLRKARLRSKAQFEKRFIKRLRREEYREGGMVLLRNLSNERRVGADVKMSPRYLGPLMIGRRNRGGAYVLKELDGTELPGRAPQRRSLPYVRRQHGFLRANRNGNLSDSSSDDEGSAEGNESADERN